MINFTLLKSVLLVILVTSVVTKSISFPLALAYAQNTTVENINQSNTLTISSTSRHSKSVPLKVKRATKANSKNNSKNKKLSKNKLKTKKSVPAETNKTKRSQLQNTLPEPTPAPTVAAAKSAASPENKVQETAPTPTSATTVQTEAAPAAAESSPWQPKAGVFVTALYGFDLRNQSFNITFWSWFIHHYDDYKPEETTEIVNAHSYLREKTAVDLKDHNVKWAQVKFTGEIAHNWDIANFPFDRQTLKVIMEDSKLDYAGLRYMVDKPNSRIDSNVQLPDWNIIGFNLQGGPVSYNTTYGDPDLEDGESTYGRLTVNIILERKGTRLFFNMFTALYVAFILSSIAFFVPLDNTSARLSLATAAIFSAVGNKYVVDSMLPPTATLTLVDKLQAATFLFIGIMVIITVSYAYAVNTPQVSKTKEELMNKINHYGEVIFPLSYFLLNAYWIYGAISYKY